LNTRVKAFVTGGTGFIGGTVARKLRERGDQVVALVRSPEKAAALTALGCDLVPGDLGDQAAIARGVEGCDSVFHVAAMYEVGIPASARPAMYEANVRGTERVLDAAAGAGVNRICYVSTINVFGNTHGKVVDERYHRDEAEGFVSYYDETKYRSHQLVLDRIAGGAPIVIAQPGGVYGAGDHSVLGHTLDQVRTGNLPVMTFPEAGFNLLHVEDAADGILLVHDKGRIGEAYVLGGEITTMGDGIRKAAALSGRKPPRITMPTVLVKMSIPIAPLVTRMMGLPPNLRELITAADGVTYWATDAKARQELGYAPRDLDTGLTQTLAALEA
jgi:nucleoside-diphosphate-sugar epimerase